MGDRRTVGAALVLAGRVAYGAGLLVAGASAALSGAVAGAVDR